MHKEVSFSLPINCFCVCPGQGDAGPLKRLQLQLSAPGFPSLGEKEPETDTSRTAEREGKRLREISEGTDFLEKEA